MGEAQKEKEKQRQRKEVRETARHKRGGRKKEKGKYCKERKITWKIMPLHTAPLQPFLAVFVI